MGSNSLDQELTNTALVRLVARWGNLAHHICLHGVSGITLPWYGSVPGSIPGVGSMFELNQHVDVIADRPHAGLPNTTDGLIWAVRRGEMTTIRLTEAGFVLEQKPDGNYYCVRWSGSEWDWFAEDELIAS